MGRFPCPSAARGTRTHTPFRAPDSKSGKSTNSIRAACWGTYICGHRADAFGIRQMRYAIIYDTGLVRTFPGQPYELLRFLYVHAFQRHSLTVLMFADDHVVRAYAEVYTTTQWILFRVGGLAAPP
jgi:hypothetical protein